jgi:FkbM family methyltransferase
MNIAHCFTKPYFAYRPMQIWRRVAFELNKGSERYRWVTVPWGLKMRVDLADDIGQVLATTGVNDLLVSEAIFRLLAKGETAIDVGANIGYMTGIMAVCVGNHGKVIAIEPHPKIYHELCEHVTGWEEAGKISPGAVKTINAAVSNKEGEATLIEPATFEGNRGRSSLEKNFETAGSVVTSQAGRHRTKTLTLDSLCSASERIDLLKVDVEGHEEEVFLGGLDLLRSRRLRDIVFEEFAPYPAPTHRLLEANGFEIFFLEERLYRPRLQEIGEHGKQPQFAPPSFLATKDPKRLRDCFQSWGWRCLQGSQI